MKNKISVNCQSSIRIEGDKIIYFDPYKISEAKNDADIIFITHDHFDHLDFSSLKKVMKKETKLVVPVSIMDEVLKGNLEFQEIMAVQPNTNYDILGLKFKTIRSYNVNKNFHPKSKDYVGYLLQLNEEKIYVMGDSDITEEALQVKCDIALIPIGGTYTMNYEEASTLVNKIKPKIVIPTHYGTIVGKMEDVSLFKDRLTNDITMIKPY